jgi:hypothetical protein
VGVAIVELTVRPEVMVPFAAGVTDAGVKVQVTVAFTGAMAQVNTTAELKLFNDVTVIVELVEFPTVVVADMGAALKLKSGAAPTFNE